jgi:TetR/AcrR family transcriptional regulator, regulator of biofilm formation and stress response
MRPRRTDPERRDRLVDVAIELIAEVGVAGISHRKVAARADVPLGSMTYHFDGMEQLLHEAFTRFAERIAASFEARLGAAQDREQAVTAVVDLVHELSDPAHAADWAVTYELYVLAARDPRYRAITTSWMRRSRHELQRHFDPAVTRQIDALIEGLSLHRALDEHPSDRAVTEDAVRKMVGPPVPAGTGGT